MDRDSVPIESMAIKLCVICSFNQARALTSFETLNTSEMGDTRMRQEELGWVVCRKDQICYMIQDKVAGAKQQVTEIIEGEYNARHFLFFQIFFNLILCKI